MSGEFTDPKDHAAAARIMDVTRGFVTNKARCRSCNAEIFWAALPSGKSAPYDADTGPDKNVVSHFATCPNASHHRKAK